MEASALAAPIDGRTAIMALFISSSLTSCSNSACRIRAAADITSPSFLLSAGVGAMNARATAGGPEGLALASPGATSEGSLVRKLKKPPGAAGFFGGGA